MSHNERANEMGLGWELRYPPSTVVSLAGRMERAATNPPMCSACAAGKKSRAEKRAPARRRKGPPHSGAQRGMGGCQKLKSRGWSWGQQPHMLVRRRKGYCRIAPASVGGLKRLGRRARRVAPPTCAKSTVLPCCAWQQQQQQPDPPRSVGAKQSVFWPARANQFESLVEVQRAALKAAQRGLHLVLQPHHLQGRG